MYSGFPRTEVHTTRSFLETHNFQVYVSPCISIEAVKQHPEAANGTMATLLNGCGVGSWDRHGPLTLTAFGLCLVALCSALNVLP
jgi:hypothetical protein